MGDLDFEWMVGVVAKHLKAGSTPQWALAKAITHYRHLCAGVMTREGYYVDPDAMKRRRK